jgi:hypothetical protein
MSETTTDAERISEDNQWPDLAIGLYDRLTGRNAEIIYEFEDMEIQVPEGVGEDAEHATWYLDGTITITTRERD